MEDTSQNINWKTGRLEDSVISNSSKKQNINEIRYHNKQGTRDA